MSDLEYEQSALSHVQKYPSLKNRTPVKLVKKNDNAAVIVRVVCFIQQMVQKRNHSRDEASKVWPQRLDTKEIPASWEGICSM